MTTPTHSISVQDEVLGNIRRRAVGAGTVADLNLPQDFLRRVADRVIRDSYQQHFRRVVGESTEPGAVPHPLPSGTKSAEAAVVDPPRLSPKARAARAEIPEAPAALPGFRAAVLAEAELQWPSAAPTDEPYAAGAALVRSRLAHDGLVPTLVRAIACVGLDHLGNRAQRDKTLQRLGLPIDLLAHFESDTAIVERAVAALKAGTPIEAVVPDLGSVPFKFQPTRPGFRIGADTGERVVRTLRIHATRAEYWGGPGAGSSLDVIRQLARQCPDTRMVVGADEKLAAVVARICGSWGNASRFTVAASRGALSQWAQDNGKAGEFEGQQLTLLPRYASRGEHETTVVPADSFIADTLAGADIAVAQSPLLFQGGNLAAARNPATGELTLLVGEAEVYRNTRLGLTRVQAEEALRLEFGADRSVVLPAVSFHIDFEFTLRVHDGRLLAFVNDTGAALRPIVRAGLNALLSSPAVGPHEQLRIRGALTRMLPVDILAATTPILNHHAVGAGAFPFELTRAFSTAPHDSGVGNFQTFLLALDLLNVELYPAHRPQDRHLRAYQESFTRRDADRKKLWRLLESLGATLVRVPSMADNERSLNYLNGLQEPGRYLMPAHGGLYAPLDAAAADAFARALPGVEVVPVLCAETQRRAGGLHCAVAEC